MPVTNDHFKFPLIPGLSPSSDKPVCVVGLMGRSRAGPSSFSSILNAAINGANFTTGSTGIQVKLFTLSDFILNFNFPGLHI